MSLEVFGDEGDGDPDGYVTEDRAQEMADEAVAAERERLRPLIDRLIASAEAVYSRHKFGVGAEPMHLRAAIDEMRKGVAENASEGAQTANLSPGANGR